MQIIDEENNSSWMNLPAEIWLEIAKKLSFDDVKNLRSTIKFFKKVLQPVFIQHIEDFQIIQIAAGISHALFLQRNGKVRTCGDNTFGQLGLIGGHPRSIPTLIPNLGDDVIKIAASRYSSFLLKRNGTVWSWGDGEDSQLGHSQARNYYQPVLVENLHEVEKIISTHLITYFLTKNGEVYSCGSSRFGALGLGEISQQNTPKRINISGVREVIPGMRTVFFIKIDGAVYACGDNSLGQLGLGDKESCNTPKQIEGLTQIIKVVCSVSHTLFLKENGEAYGCGSNLFGQLGAGNTLARTARLILRLDNIIDIIAGDTYTFFIKKNGTVLGCGDNRFRQLGINNTRPSSPYFQEPTELPRLENVKKIFTRKSCTLFCQANGHVYRTIADQDMIYSIDNKTNTSLFFQKKYFKEMISVDDNLVFPHKNNILFLQEDGTVLAQGPNEDGELGLPGKPSASTPTVIPGLSKWQQVLEKILENSNNPLSNKQKNISGNSSNEDINEEDEYSQKRSRLF